MKAIIFDVDGVLINSKDELGIYLWQKEIEKDLGLNPDHMRQLFSSDWSLVLKGIVGTRQYFKTVLSALNIDLSVDIFIEYWLEHDLSVNTEIFSMIKSIRGSKLYVGTNQDSLRTIFLQEKFGLYFDGFFASYQMGVIKPEPEYFRYIESNLDLQPANIAFIDDSTSNIEVAARLGWTCHHYQNIEEFKKFIKNL